MSQIFAVHDMTCHCQLNLRCLSIVLVFNHEHSYISSIFLKKIDEYVWNFVKNTLIQNSYLNEFFIILKKIFNLVVSLFTNNDSPVSTMLVDPHDKLRIVSNQVIKLGYSFVYRFAWGRSHSENQPFWDFFCKLDMKLWSDILFLWYGKSLFFVLSTRNVTYEFTGYSSRAITRTFCTGGHP